MNGTFRSGSLTLNRYLAVPSGHQPQLPGVILCHGFPIGPLDARQSAVTFPQLMDRIANDLGWAALTFTFRGCGTSDGDFSMQGWVDDLRAAIDHLEEEVSPQGIWLVGTNTGGALALCVAADDPRVRGCALMGARADFDDWAGSRVDSLNMPRRLALFEQVVSPNSLMNGAANYVASVQWTQRTDSHRGLC